VELMDKEVGRDCVVEPCRVIDLIGRRIENTNNK